MMPPDDHRAEEGPLFGPSGRIPAVQAVVLSRASGITALRHGWLPRHWVSMVVLSPLLFVLYRATFVGGLEGVFVDAISGGLALVAALVLTTYLPLRGVQRAPGASCAMMPAMLVPAAAVLVHQTAGPIGGALALTILSLALWQRLSGASACG